MRRRWAFPPDAGDDSAPSGPAAGSGKVVRPGADRLRGPALRESRPGWRTRSTCGSRCRGFERGRSPPPADMMAPSPHPSLRVAAMSVCHQSRPATTPGQTAAWAPICPVRRPPTGDGGPRTSERVRHRRSREPAPSGAREAGATRHPGRLRRLQARRRLPESAVAHAQPVSRRTVCAKTSGADKGSPSARPPARRGGQGETTYSSGSRVWVRRA